MHASVVRTLEAAERLKRAGLVSQVAVSDDLADQAPGMAILDLVVQICSQVSAGEGPVDVDFAETAPRVYIIWEVGHHTMVLEEEDNGCFTLTEVRNG